MSDEAVQQGDRLALEEKLREEPDAWERYAKLPEYKVDMCLRWVAEAPTPALREGRIARLVRRLWLTSFAPYYALVGVVGGVGGGRYGEPRPLRDLPPEEQVLALKEERVL